MQELLAGKLRRFRPSARSVGFAGDLLRESFCGQVTCTFWFMHITTHPSSFLQPRKMISSLKRLVRSMWHPRASPAKRRPKETKPDIYFSAVRVLFVLYTRSRESHPQLKPKQQMLTFRVKT